MSEIKLTSCSLFCSRQRRQLKLRSEQKVLLPGFVKFISFKLVIKYYLIHLLYSVMYVLRHCWSCDREGTQAVKTST